MPPRRRHERRESLDPDVKLFARWETERDVVGYAVMLLAKIESTWRTVVLFDCTHGDRNDRHRYSFDGVKEPAVIFHHGSPGKAMNDAIDLIKADYERMIERWRP
jgi:hypothetical protein